MPQPVVPTWRFSKREPGIVLRNPMGDDYFNDERVGSVAAAVIREGIQNAMDASGLPKPETTPEKQRPALVVIKLVDTDEAPTWGDLNVYFQGLWKHLRAKNSGIADTPHLNDKCRLLIFEDFGATGLLGDPAVYEVDEDDPARNDFYAFFHAEAFTPKKEGGGSRGIGKVAFWKASSIRTFFGLTRRAHDPRYLLMGRTLIRGHRVDPYRYFGDGFFGVPSQEHSALTLPDTDHDRVADFIGKIGVTRESETGLSVIVPGVRDDISEDQIVKAVARNCFIPIILGRLEVFLETAKHRVVLDRKYLSSFLERNKELHDVRSLVALLNWSQGDASDTTGLRLELPVQKAPGVPNWGKALHECDREPIRSALESGEPVAVRVHIKIRARHSKEETSFFDVYFRANDAISMARPYVVRDDIFVPEAGTAVPKTDSLVVVRDPALAGFLRQSENPSHTVWLAERVKEQYINAPGTLRFVKDAVKAIRNFAYEDEAKVDRRVLAEFFPRAKPDGRGKQSSRKGRLKVIGGDPPFQIGRVKGGVTVRPDQVKFAEGAIVEVRVAYDTRRGSALKKYRPEDFDLKRKPMSVSVVGAAEPEILDNVVRFRVTAGEAWSLTICGFDIHRQVFVQADVVGGEVQQ